MRNKYYDCIIIGSGAAGCNAGIYGADCGLNIMICQGPQPGGLITTTHIVDNYLGISNINGLDLADKFEEHARNKQCIMKPIIINNIHKISINDNNNIQLFQLTDLYGDQYYAGSIIICAGSSPVLLPLNQQYTGKHLHYCATCDGFLYKNKNVVVVGGGNSAMESIIYLSSTCNKITLIYRGNKLTRPHQTLINKINTLVDEGKLNIYYNTIITNIDNNTNHIDIITNNEQKTILTDIHGIFVNIGHNPNIYFTKDIGIQLNSDNSIMVDNYYETNISGIYAAGDILGDYVTEHKRPRSRQLVSAATEGMDAVLNIHKKHNDRLKALRKIIFND